jgi:hypothetical protein
VLFKGCIKLAEWKNHYNFPSVNTIRDYIAQGLFNDRPDVAFIAGNRWFINPDKFAEFLKERKR